ncbi:MAG: HAD family hydrolase [Candidatus Nanosalina sp.]
MAEDTGYDLVVFDFDGLVDSGFDGFECALKARQEVVEENGWNIDLNGFEQGIEPHHSEDLEPFLEEKDISWKQLQFLEERVAERKIEMARNGKIKLFPDTEKVLGEIKADKAVVTNAYGGHLREMLEALGISEHFRHVTGPRLSNIESYRERMKPEAAMLKDAREKFGAERAVMVGDQIEDILAARKAGMDSIHVNRDGEKIPRADYEVSELSQISEIVQD